MKTVAKPIYLLTLLTLFAASGAVCPGYQPPIYVAPPQVLSPQPTLPQLIEVVNANSAKIQSLSSNQATVSVAGLPALSANLAVGSPRRIRLTAGTGLSGEEIDLGSNDELFWLWVKRNQPPNIYFCRHNEFERSAARQIIPVRPEWVASALGMVRLDPSAPHELRIAANRNLEIYSTWQDGQQTFRRVTVLEPNAGWVVEQHMYAADGTLVASAFNSQHVPDPATGAVLPRTTRVKWPRTGMEFTLTLRDLQVNPAGLNEQLFQMPSIDGYQHVNLGVPGASPLGIPANHPQTNYAPPTQWPVQPVGGYYPTNSAGAS
ncbi:MAG: hypothetical protein WD030_03885, partial [Pirellulales bacterium]